MGLIQNIWKKLTPTVAPVESTGKFETLFFKFTYRITYLLGLSMKNQKLLYQLYRNIMSLLLFMIMIGEICAPMANTFDMDLWVFNINLVVLQISNVYRFRSTVNNSKVFEEIARSMDTPNFDTSTDKRQKLVSVWASLNEKSVKILLIFGSCTFFLWIVLPLVDNVEYNLHIPIMVPFNYNTPLRYALVYMTITAVFLYLTYFMIINILIMQTHMIHLLCQFNVLSDCFENLLSECRVDFLDVPQNLLIYNESFVRQYTKRLSQLTEQHKIILKHTMNLRNAMSQPLLGHLTTSGFLICFNGFQTATALTESFTKSFANMLSLLYSLFDFYIICRLCEEITLESQRIGVSIYSSGWENGLATIPGVKSSILLIIARAYKPLIFKAGGFCDISLASYSTLVKTSYSVLTMMLNVNREVVENK